MAKIKTITVSNLKAVSNMTANFEGCTAIVTGGNNKGKTSFLRGLMDRLRGVKPDVIVKQGEKEMNSEIELTTGEKFIWSVNGNGNEKLLFVTSEAIKVPVTKAICEKYFPETFDIDKFLNESPKQQRKILQDLAGIDFSIIDAEYKQAYEERTYANRKRDEEKAKAGAVSVDPALPVEFDGTELAQLRSELATIGMHNERFENAKKTLADLANETASIDSEIKELEAKVLGLYEKRKGVQERIEKGIAWTEVEENKPKTVEAVEKLKSDIAGHELKERQIKANNEAKLLVEASKVAAEAAENADKKVKEIETRKLELIKTANLPEGFAFTDDGIEINGLPVTREQLSSSRLYIAALKLASMKLGKVNTLHFDASHLDKNSLAEIEAWANEGDLQLLIERPDFDGGEITYEILGGK